MNTIPLSQKQKGFFNKLRIDEIVVIVLLLFSGVGIALTDFDPSKGYWYWVAMAPLFWGGCVYMEWSRVEGRGETRLRMIRRQTIHWIGFLAGIHLAFLLSYTGRINNADFGLVALLVLALSAFFAGIYCDWRISLVGVFLGIAVSGVALIEEYIWLILILLAAVVVAAMVWWSYRKAARSKTQ